MIKEAYNSPIPPNPSTMAAHFPSPALIVMSVVSCFLTTTAFAAALTQAGWFGFFLIPSTIGFLATIPYHIYLYNYARRLVEPEPSAKGARFLPTEALVLIFVLITLWVVIFFIDILFCVGTGPGTPVGIVLSTIAAGLHWIVLAFVALKCTRESWRAEKAASSSAGAGSTPYETSDEETLTGYVTFPPIFSLPTTKSQSLGPHHLYRAIYISLLSSWPH